MTNNTPRAVGHLRWIVPGSTVLLWIVFTETGLVRGLILPAPSSIIAAALDIGPLELSKHTLATTGRVISGFFLGSYLGYQAGTRLAFFPKLNALWFGLVETWRPVPAVALIPFFLLWFGPSELGRILIVVLGAALVTVVQAHDAVRAMPRELIRTSRSLGLTEKVLHQDIAQPYALSRLWPGLRIALALSFTLVIVSEFMGAPYGLGKLINFARLTVSTPVIMLGVIIIGIVAVGMDYCLRISRNFLIYWDSAES